MPLHTKLFVVSALLFFIPIALLLGDVTFLNCFDGTRMFADMLRPVDVWMPESLKVIPAGLGVLLVAFILEKRFHGKSVVRIVFESVLIIIVGLVLGSLILASLNTARSKGPNAQVKSIMSQARVSAEIYYDGNGNSYEGFCVSPVLASLQDALKNETYGQGLLCSTASINFTCIDDADAFALSSKLPTTRSLEAKYFCVDSTGYASTIVGSITETSCK